MIAYFIPPISILLLKYLNNININNIRTEIIGIKYWIIILAIFIYCGGYMTGSDWRSYEIIYNSISIKGALSYTRENVFYLYMLIFKTLGISFINFLIFSKILIFCCITYNILKYSIDEYFALFLFWGIQYFTLFIFVNNPLRFMIAMGIISFSYEKIIKRSFLSYIIIILIAAYFHISALIMIPVYFFQNIINISKIKIILIYSIYYLIFSREYILLFAKLFNSIIPFFTFLLRTYLIRMQYEQNSLFSIGSIFNYLIFIIIIINSEKIKSKKYGKFIFYMSLIYFISFKLGLLIPTISRISLYFFIFYISSITILIKEIKHRNILILFLIIYTIISSYKSIYNSYVYYPYSNYYLFSSINGQKDYQYRSDYNINAYYNRFGKYPQYFEGVDYEKEPY